MSDDVHIIGLKDLQIGKAVLMRDGEVFWAGSTCDLPDLKLGDRVGLSLADYETLAAIYGSTA